MSLGVLTAVVLAAASPEAAASQTAPAAQAPVLASANTQVASASYPASFFRPIQPSTALDMVNNLPGFVLDLGDSERGFGGAAGNVLIDGERPATKTDTLDTMLQRIPAASVARIDVIRGGAPGIDMQGKTVIANVVLNHDQGLKLTIASGGVFATSVGRFYPSGRIEGTDRIGDTKFEASFLGGLGADDGTGPGRRVVHNGAGEVIQTAHEDIFGLGDQAKVTAAVETPVLGGALRIEGSVQTNPYTYTDSDTLIAPPGREYEKFTQDQDTEEIGLRYQHPLGPRSSLETFVLQQFGQFSYVDTFDQNDFGVPADLSHFTLNKRTGESIVRSVWKFTPNGHLSVQAGVEGALNWLDNRTVLTDNGAPVAIPAANVRVEEKRGEAFATATWQLNPKVTLETGVRVEGSAISSTGDVVSTEHFVFPKPRAVLTWSPDASDQMRLRVEREVSQLDFGDFTASGSLGTGTHAGNPQLSPQQDWVIEGAYERRFWGAGDASITLRRYWLTDVIDRAPTCSDSALLPTSPPTCDPTQEFDEPANVGNGYKDELAVSLTLPTDKMFLPGGLFTLRATWRRSGVTDPSTHRMREISGLHPVDSEAHFTQGIPAIKSTWGFDLFPNWRQTYYRFSEVDTDKLGTWLDVFIEYKPRPDWTFRAELDNAVDHGYEHIRQFYTPFRDAPDATVSSVDHRFPHFGEELFFRARRTFG